MKISAERREAIVWMLKWIAYELGCWICITLLMLALRGCVPAIFESVLEGEATETIASFVDWGQQACSWIVAFMIVLCVIMLGVIIYRGIQRIHDAA